MINHPLNKGTRVKYLLPKCKCSGGGYLMRKGTIVGYTKNKNNKYVYTIDGRAIPELGITGIIWTQIKQEMNQ